MSPEFPKKPDRPQLYGYKLELALGRGGTGTVYRAIDLKSGDVVAVKLFRANFFRNPMHMRDLAKTVKKFRKFNHDNVVGIREFLSGEEGECVVMEYIDGPDLKWYLANRPWDLRERLVIVAQICNGLAYIHDKGFMHHDLKPANILFTRRGQAKLCDFSLCGTSYLLSLFDSGVHEQITPMYVAPEIIRKEKAGHLSDIYSLGVLLYLLFTERVPFEVDDLQKLYLCHLQSKPLHPSMVYPACPHDLGDIIMNLLDKDPSKRLPNADQIRIALAGIGQSRI